MKTVKLEVACYAILTVNPFDYLLVFHMEGAKQQKSEHREAES